MHMDKLLILDEIQRAPEIFSSMRSMINAARRNGKKHGQYLILSSASLNLLKQSSESLAGRITYLERQRFVLNASQLTTSLNINGQTVSRYIDLLVDLFSTLA